MISDRPELALPHRPPFVWVTRLMSREASEGLGVKGVVELDLVKSDPVFAGHFPGDPVFPGVLQVEAAAQSCLWIFMGAPQEGGRVPDGLLVSIDAFKFRGIVRPPATLEIRCEKIKQKSWLQYWKAEVYFESKVCASGHFWLGLNPPSRAAASAQR